MSQILNDLNHGTELTQARTGGQKQTSCAHPLQSKYQCLQTLMDVIIVKKSASLGVFEDCWNEFFQGVQTCLALNQLSAIQ